MKWIIIETRSGVIKAAIFILTNSKFIKIIKTIWIIYHTIRYLYVVGDLVDGVGVYPGQEEDLAIKDISKQYEELAKLLKTVREDITIIVCGGQHDALRRAEPQPGLGKDFAKSLLEIPNLVILIE